MTAHEYVAGLYVTLRADDHEGAKGLAHAIASDVVLDPAVDEVQVGAVLRTDDPVSRDAE